MAIITMVQNDMLDRLCKVWKRNEENWLGTSSSSLFCRIHEVEVEKPEDIVNQVLLWSIEFSCEREYVMSSSYQA